MTKKIEPTFMNNRAPEQAYGCGCICSGHHQNHSTGKNAGINTGDCGCTCHSIVNAYANADLAYDHKIWKV